MKNKFGSIVYITTFTTYMKLITTKVTKDTIKNAKKIAAEKECKQYEAIDIAVKEKLERVEKKETIKKITNGISNCRTAPLH